MNKPEEKMKVLKKLVFLSLVLPVSLMALETVNLIKNHSFEHDASNWLEYTGFRDFIENDSAVANAHDPEASIDGLFSSSTDTRFPPGDPTPPPITIDSAVVIQGFIDGKALKDLDSLTFHYKLSPPESGFQNTYFAFSSLVFTTTEETLVWGVYYFFNTRFNPPGDDPPHRLGYSFAFDEDTTWFDFKRGIQSDWISTKGLSGETLLDSFAVGCYGALDPSFIGWFGQKVYWDDVRLMGYADYDVGVKEILSGDELEVGVEYIPVARVKNFGREDAEEFNVIAEVWDGETLIYEETIPHTLPGDTEDTLEFPPFTPTYMTTYTLTIRTEMVTPAIDECDEDDQLSKTIGTAGIADDPTTPTFTLDVTPITSALQVSYTLPSGQPASLSVYDATGRRVEHLLVTGAGSTTIPALPSGVYFVRLSTYFRRITRKVVLR